MTKSIHLCVGKQPWELGKKYEGNFIFTFAVVKVRYAGIKRRIFLNMETI